MRVGLDLDGTIVVYDAIFHRVAGATVDLPGAVPVRKEAVRDWLREQKDGERLWIELQAQVYGPLMDEAPPAPGVLKFIRDCRDAGVGLSIVSHRTSRSVADAAIDLHAAALRWLERHEVTERVFLETTRDAKLRRIGSENCSLFVDDLQEVLNEPAFPNGTERWLYAPDRPERMDRGIHSFADWALVLRRAVELRETDDDG